MIIDIALCVLVVISSLHYFPYQHWVFRSLEFAKIQLTCIQLIALLVLIYFFSALTFLSIILGLVLVSVFIHNLIILVPYTKLFPRESKALKSSGKPISFLAVNVYQYNDQYHLLINLIKELKPDILLTIESNKKWEKALEQVEHYFRNSKKIPQDNTYGMHFYTTLGTDSIKVNYFVADDLPTIEANLLTSKGKKFKFFGVHPPPPSPTEEETSKERDGDILALGKKIQAIKDPCLVVGDFNNVAWSRSSKLFKKSTQLLDPRIGRGFISTFHAKYLFFRFPIDLVFHNNSIYIQSLRTEKHINSDHFPIYGEFVLNAEIETQESISEETNPEEDQQIDEMIDEGQSVESDNRENV